jgi:hypothetical protein
MYEGYVMIQNKEHEHIVVENNAELTYQSCASCFFHTVDACTPA